MEGGVLGGLEGLEDYFGRRLVVLLLGGMVLELMQHLQDLLLIIHAMKDRYGSTRVFYYFYEVSYCVNKFIVLKIN